MSQLRWGIVLLVLTACSAKEEGDDPANVLAKGTVSATTGAMIFHDGDPGVVLSIAPAAVMQDVEVTLSKSDADLDVDALSPVITVAPKATELAFPGSISIVVAAATPNAVIARVTENGVERVPGSSVDATTHEVQAPVRHFGSFVVVDGATTPLAEPEGLPAAGGDLATQDSATVGPQPNALPVAGTWQGVGPHQDFTLSLIDSTFTVSKEGRVVREGSFSVSGNALSLVDSAGKTEVASITLANNEMTLDSAQSGTVRWQLQNPPVVAEAPSGFFSTTAELEQRTEPSGVDAAQPPGPSAVAAAPRAKPAKPPRTSTKSSSATAKTGTTATEPKKKNIFERLGSGVKNAATSVVHGVQNIGKSKAKETQQEVDAAAAQGEQQMVEAADAVTSELACDRIVGDWAWFLGGTVNFTSKSRVRWQPPGGSPATGTWTCVPGTGKYIVTWENGFIDTLDLNADGTQLSGVSSTGVAVSGRRIAGGGGATSSSSSAAPNSTSEGWTSIGNAGVGKQSTVPISGGVPQRIGPQGRPPPKGAG